MQRKTLALLLFILVIAGCAAYTDWPHNPGLQIDWLGIHHPLKARLGLDLQGGVRVLLEPEQTQSLSGETLTREMEAARDQIEQRVNGGLGVNEPIVRVQTSNGQPQINFAMQGDAVGRFSEFTRQNRGNILTVTLDREVIQSATIQSAITGPGVITGQFTNEEAQRTATVLRYGALPIALKIASQQTIGPTLGQDSLNKSQVAGAIGIGIVMLFMLLYYRLPGLLADLALLLYTALTFAIFKLVGVTLTLAGIAGFILSIGMAVDANVLVFERVKEELRAGRLLAAAIAIGWKRAWPSIRDSNITTMITCAVLYVFGNNFGASRIVGFVTT